MYFEFTYISVLACAVISSCSISPLLTLATMLVKKSCREALLWRRLAIRVSEKLKIFIEMKTYSWTFSRLYCRCVDLTFEATNGPIHLPRIAKMRNRRKLSTRTISRTWCRIRSIQKWYLSAHQSVCKLEPLLA